MLATPSRNACWLAAGVALVWAGGLVPAGANEAAPLRFDRDIRPILAENCLSCHGPGKQEAGLRLDTAAGSTASLD
ncbi:MAG: c-type cytochrome domain-containing protein, partial [Planctomycetota bacterium]